MRKYSTSSHLEMVLGKGVLKICSKFTGKHPCWSVISIKLLCNFIDITLRHGCCPVNLLHIFKTLFSNNTSGWLLLNFWFKWKQLATTNISRKAFSTQTSAWLLHWLFKFFFYIDFTYLTFTASFFKNQSRKWLVLNSYNLITAFKNWKTEKYKIILSQHTIYTNELST